MENNNTSLAPIPKTILLTLENYIQKFCELRNKDWNDVLWIGDSGENYIVNKEQFSQLAQYLIRGPQDIPQDLTIVFNDGTTYNFNCRNTRDILSDENLEVIFTPHGNRKPLTPYILFDLNNFRQVPPIDIVNGDPIRLKIFMLNLDLIKLWNKLIDHNFIFNVLTNDIINPDDKGPIHTKCFDNCRIGDVMLRIHIKGLTEYHSSPERQAIVNYIDTVLSLNTNFLKYEDIPATSSILLFFRPFGGF